MIKLAGILSVALMGCAGHQSKHPCRLGLTLNVSVNGGTKELLDSVLEEQKLGCNLMAASVKWADLEPMPGVIKLDKLKQDFANHAQFGFITVLTLQTIDTNNRTVPTDLVSEPWDSPKMIARETAFLKRLAAILPPKIGAVCLGNEVDAYLSSHRSEVDGYLRFLSTGREVLKREHPGTQIGVTTEFSALGRERDMITRLQSGMDLVSMTYYPLTPDFGVQPVGDVEKHFEHMIAFSGQRMLFLQEAGYPAATLLSSSDQKQAAFVDALFDAMTRHGDHLYGICYFILVDFSDKLVDSLLGYYGLGTDRFRAMLSTLGLKKQDGTPRPAWAEFKKRAATFEAVQR
jgi:hypothetical protein